MFFKVCFSKTGSKVFPSTHSLPNLHEVHSEELPLDLNSLCLYHLLHHRGCHQGPVFLHLRVPVDGPVSNSLDPIQKSRNITCSQLASRKGNTTILNAITPCHKKESTASTILQLMENSCRSYLCCLVDFPFLL